MWCAYWWLFAVTCRGHRHTWCVMSIWLPQAIDLLVFLWSIQYYTQRSTEHSDLPISLSVAPRTKGRKKQPLDGTIIVIVMRGNHLFMLYLWRSSVYQAIYSLEVSSGRCRRKRSWPELRYYAGICLQGLGVDMLRQSRVPAKIWPGQWSSSSEKCCCLSQLARFILAY